MSSEPAAETPEKALVPWPKRAGLGGMLMAGGAALGLVAVFLPLASVSMEMMGGMMSGGGTVMVIDVWRGKATLLARWRAGRSPGCSTRPGGRRRRTCAGLPSGWGSLSACWPSGSSSTPCGALAGPT